MTVEELRETIKYLPGDMLVILPFGKEYILASVDLSRPLDIVFQDDDGEIYSDGAFLIAPGEIEEDETKIAQEAENNPN